MAFKSIMVYVDFDERSETRIGVAADLAKRFDAVLIGIAGWPLRKSGSLAHSDMQYPATEENLQAKVTEELERLGQMFRRCAGSAPRGIEWRSSPHFPNEVVVAQARAADLVIIGRDSLRGDSFHTFDPGAIILACGRPVLVLPSGINRLNAARVLIAWKDTREARRAVSDALPLLKEAESVIIAAVGPQEIELSMREQVDDVANYLQRHGVTIGAKLATSTRDADVQVLLGLADEHKTDLIVAGAYGRSRLSEWIFGGVTRTLLTASKIPMLFAN
jgi:nucleotide-binding universal stress UspA family protein